MKSRGITLPTKVCIIKALVFPAVRHGGESRMVKEAEHQRTDAFKLWCWRRLLRIPFAAGRSNQSILREINPEYSLEGLMQKLKLHSFGHLMQRANPLAKSLMLGEIEGRRRRGSLRVRWLDGITDAVVMNLGKLWEDGEGQGGLACCSPRGHRVGRNWVTEQQQQQVTFERTVITEVGGCVVMG